MTSSDRANTSTRLAMLTPAQRECLDLVRRRKTAKQIARELGITHHAVEQRLKSARHKLGVETTADAIDLIEASEREAYGGTVYGPTEVATADENWPSPLLSPPPGGDSGKEVMVAFSPLADLAPAPPSAFDMLKDLLLGDAEAMSWRHRLLFMAAIVLGSTVTAILLVSFIEGLSRLSEQ